MNTVNIQEAKTHLSRLIEEVVQGEEVVIAKAGKPMVRLVPVSSLAGPRPLGLLAGQVRETEGWWAPDRELDALFYGDEAEGSAEAAGRAGKSG
jgi:prevent-host-death family protein